MKNTRIYMVLLMSFIFMLIVFARVNDVQAAGYDGMTVGKDVEVNKSWNIKFNIKLDTNTVNGSNIVVTDSDGNVVPVSLQVGQDGTNIVVTPKTQYTYGKTYNLTVKNGLKSAYGKSLKDQPKMQFTVKSNPTSSGNAKYTVTIDAGHGGTDFGNVSKSGIKEKDVNLSVALKAGKILEQNGVNVVYTRKDDNVTWDSSSDLQTRFDIANKANSDLFVALRCNSYAENSQVSGIETYYTDCSDSAKNAAEKIQNEMISYTGRTDRGIKAGVYKHTILRGTVAPAVMVELGFMTSTEESALLGSDDYQNKSAAAIANGVLKSLGSMDGNKGITISSISNLSDNITVGSQYSLPTSVQATMSDGTSKKVPVIWSADSIDSSKTGVFTYNGTVPGYSKQVLFTLTIVSKPTETPPSSGTPGTPVIVIDPGHGMGNDIGATGINGLQEDDITLAVGLKTGAILQSKGINVVYTRTTDMRSVPMSVNESLQKRCDISNDANAKYFVCIHANYFTESSAHGTETLYYTGNSEGEKLALNIQNSIVKEVGMYDRGLKDGSWLYIAKNTNATSALVELGFVSSPDDAAKLSSDEYRQKFAQAIADGILQTLGYK
ncbi:N-acetylmuramoyl-L-alanine amidase [Clostridium sp. Mt-5]|uniref:N-acetylmuramoyl-L-alanine amidase n=1 Tax=Clostridium moutaii TaxID=3240932 RepID=A0ABV4BKP8_9CLOT